MRCGDMWWCWMPSDLRPEETPATTDLMHSRSHRDCVCAQKACTGSNTQNPSTGKRSEHGDPLLTKKLFAIEFILAGKGKIRFLPGSDTGYRSHISGQVLCPGGVGQHKKNSMFSLCVDFFFSY